MFCACSKREKSRKEVLDRSMCRGFQMCAILKRLISIVLRRFETLKYPPSCPWRLAALDFTWVVVVFIVPRRRILITITASVSNKQLLQQQNKIK